MKKTACIVLTVVCLALASAYAGSKPRIAPPPPRVEVQASNAVPGYVWIPGYWKWAGVNYVWATGHWAQARANKIWVAGTWSLRGSYWVWKPGRWEKIKVDKPKPPKKPRKDE